MLNGDWGTAVHFLGCISGLHFGGLRAGWGSSLILPDEEASNRSLETMTENWDDLQQALLRLIEETFGNSASHSPLAGSRAGGEELSEKV